MKQVVCGCLCGALSGCGGLDQSWTLTLIEAGFFCDDALTGEEIALIDEPLLHAGATDLEIERDDSGVFHLLLGEEDIVGEPGVSSIPSIRVFMFSLRSVEEVDESGQATRMSEALDFQTGPLHRPEAFYWLDQTHERMEEGCDPRRGARMRAHMVLSLGIRHRIRTPLA